jgi:hypothetical protein
MKKYILIIIAIGLSISMVKAQTSCLDFDGNDYVDCGNDPSLDLGTGSITVEFWAKRSIGGITPLSKGFYNHSIGKTTGWKYRCNQGDKRMYIVIGDGTNSANAMESSASNDGTWHHFAGVIDRTANLIQLYKDGILQASNDISSIASISVPNDFVLGYAPNVGWSYDYWQGNLDEIRYWNTARSQAEIIQYMNQSIPGPASNPDLAAYYNFDEGSGQITHDISSNTNDGQLGSTPGSDGNDPSWGNCQIPGFNIQNCLDFDGTNDYVEIPNDPTLNPVNQITVEAWYKAVSFTGTGADPIVDKGYTSHTLPYYQYHLGVIGDGWSNSPGTFYFSIAANGTHYSASTNQNFYVPGRWYHLAGTYDGTDLKFYVNGELVDSEPVSGTMTDYGKAVRIAHYSNFTGYLPGEIDEVRVWDDARTEAEIRENCYRELPNPSSEPNLMAYYKFNQITGTTLPDHSSNGNNGTLTNMDPATDWIVSTAPIPYQTIVNGNWGLDATWNDGQMVPVNDWSRVEINNVVDYNAYEILEDLTINSGGQLEMFPGYQLNVNGNLVNNAGTNGLILRSDYLETATIIENDGVEATVERSFAGNGLDWHLISPPVSNALSGVFNDMYLQQFNEATNTYSEIIPSTVPLGTMKGYAVYSTLANMNTVSYSGNLNTGALNRAVTANMANGWNLVGNPYPSALDWNAVIPGLSGINSSIYYLDAFSGNWLTWNGTTGSGSRYAPPGQGFFVSATTAATLSFDNSMRTHDVFWMFYKDEISDLLILKAEGNGFEDKTYIHFNSEATEGFDGQFDAYKIFSEFNPQLPQIFTKVGMDNLSINELPETESMILGFRADIPGIYSINMEEANDFATVILEDTETGTTTDLLSNTYNFSYSVDEAAERFILHFSPLGVNELATDNIQVYSVENTVYVNLSEVSQFEYSILDMMGQEIQSGKLDSQNNSISLNTETGYYVVKIITGNRSVSRKVFIK